MKISEFDPNFKPCTVSGVTFQMVDAKQLTLEGFAWEAENRQPYVRLPERILSGLCQALQYLCTHAAGGVVRFRTDSSALLLKGRYRPVAAMPHMALSGVAGFDVNIRENDNERLLVNFHPEPATVHQEDYSFTYSCPLEPGMHEYRIYFPLYAGVEVLQIGFAEGAQIEAAPAHAIEKPVLFYGSSITQGGCASRPSTCHAALLSAWVDAGQINLGFSGNAKAEPVIAGEIAALDLSCFVMDYDHNAPTPEHLEKTHEPFFRIIREQKPDLPVVFVTRPLGNSAQCEDAKKRRTIIMKTYENARKNGDRRVYFVDGMHFYDGLPRELPTVDCTHPTDLGFYLMAKGILPALREALGLV